MTHSKTAFRRLLALFAPSVGSSALALSAMAGGLLLTGGQAKALTCTFSAASIDGCNYGLGGPTITAGPNGFYQQWYESNKSGTPTPITQQIKIYGLSVALPQGPEILTMIG
ncbi:MAG: hypothetical protein ACK587_08795 [Cyanobacteriota bacterium]